LVPWIACEASEVSVPIQCYLVEIQDGMIPRVLMITGYSYVYERMTSDADPLWLGIVISLRHGFPLHVTPEEGKVSLELFKATYF